MRLYIFMSIVSKVFDFDLAIFMRLARFSIFIEWVSQLSEIGFTIF